MAMVREFEERTEQLSHNLLKEAARYAEELDLLEYPNPTSIQRENWEMMPEWKLKVELRKCLERKSWIEVQDQEWHRKLIFTR